MANTKNAVPVERRPFHDQGLPLGDTGDGSTGVPSDEQGISNRPGDRPDAISVQEEESPDEDEDDEDAVDVDDEELADEDDEEESDEEEDERTDPRSEPGKPI